MLARQIERFFEQDYAVGVLLVAASVLAMLAANSFLSEYYDMLLSIPIQIAIGSLELHKPLLLWINDGLMAVFFLLIGLEVKMEIMEGNLSTPAQVILPGIGAIGGMVIPALIYVLFNYGDPVALKGWAIPAATDIAFAVGILALLGKRVPTSLTTFLLALAIIDDLGAIIIIAIFYTENLSLNSMAIGAALLVVLSFFNYKGVTRTGPYLFVGALLWICVLKSGVHATLAGVLLAFTIPLNAVNKKGYSPLKALMHALHNKVHYFILPVFAFANAGLELSADQFASLLTPIPMGVAAGLFIGKQLGVFSFCWLAVKAGIAKLPDQSTMKQMYGLSILCGIGFTMSLFIGSLAFENVSTDYLISDRIGVLFGSILSAIVGYTVLSHFSPKPVED